MGSADPSNVTFPLGSIAISPSANEISGHNPERQDFIIGPSPAPSFAGYFVARFDPPFTSWGTVSNTTIYPNQDAGAGALLSGYVQFSNDTRVVNVRVGVSFISVDQARRNLDREIPDGRALEETAYETRKAWKDKLEMIELEGASEANKTTFYTAFYHALQVSELRPLLCLPSLSCLSQYPYEQDEDGQYYSGYDDSVHEGVSYTGYSIWVRLSFGRCPLSSVRDWCTFEQDTFRAEWAWEILFTPERIPGMVTSMLQDFQEVRDTSFVPARPVR